MTDTECRICGAGDRELVSHRVVPRQYGGRDREENLVTLCVRCRTALTDIYDEAFYRRLGAAPEPEATGVELRDLSSVFDAADGDLIYAGVYNHFFAVEAVEAGWRGRRLELLPVPDRREGVDPPPSTTLYEREDRQREIEQGPIAVVEAVEGPLIETLKRHIDERR